MINKRTILGLLLLLIFAISCNSASRSLVRNQRKSDRMVNRLTHNNGNAFYNSHAFAAASLIWTYSNTELQIFKLKAGRIYERKTISITDSLNWISAYTEHDWDEITGCLALDGPFLKFGYLKKGKIHIEHLPVLYECFSAKEYKSQYFNKITSDIRKYHLGYSL